MELFSKLFAHPFAFPLILVFAIAFLVAGLLVTVLRFRGKHISAWTCTCLYVPAVFLLILSILCMVAPPLPAAPAKVPTPAPTEPSIIAIEETTEPQQEEEKPPLVPQLIFSPHYTAETNPANWEIEWTVHEADGQVIGYERDKAIVLGLAEEYSAVPGVIGFRGNNYRNSASYGTATVASQSLSLEWRNLIGMLNDWPGVGWTGQPIIVQWPEETRAVMGLNDSKKIKDNLVEVIIAGLDGYIHFYDLDDGTETRDAIWIGQNMKCSPALDPRGIPLMFVGSGTVYHGNQKMYAVSLIDNEVLMAWDGGDDDAPRGWFAFDSSPLISGETDTLLWPGESGVLYTIRLNTAYDPAAGTLSIDPVLDSKATYRTNVPRAQGYEASLVMVGKYAYLADNGGMVFCMDINSMELIWAQDCRDDINATPIFQWEEDGGALYIVTSMEFNHGTCYAFKLNAETGEIIWQHEYTDVAYDEGVSGGALSTPVLGAKGTTLEGKLILTMARTPYISAGVLSALDTETGDVLWEEVTDYYVWSSPIAIYDDDGNGYFILCDSAGNMELRNGDGDVLYALDLTYNFEASGAVYEDMLVIGSRSGYIYGVRIQ